MLERDLHEHIHRGLPTLRLTSYSKVVGHAKSLDTVLSDTKDQQKKNFKGREAYALTIRKPVSLGMEENLG